MPSYKDILMNKSIHRTANMQNGIAFIQTHFIVPSKEKPEKEEERKRRRRWRKDKEETIN